MLEVSTQLTIELGRSHLQQAMIILIRPTHLLLLHETFGDHLIHGRFDESQVGVWFGHFFDSKGAELDDATWKNICGPAYSQELFLNYLNHRGESLTPKKFGEQR